MRSMLSKFFALLFPVRGTGRYVVSRHALPVEHLQAAWRPWR